jgi:hypothetical protein
VGLIKFFIISINSLDICRQFKRKHAILSINHRIDFGVFGSFCVWMPEFVAPMRRHHERMLEIRSIPINIGRTAKAESSEFSNFPLAGPIAVPPVV